MGSIEREWMLPKNKDEEKKTLHDMHAQKIYCRNCRNIWIEIKHCFGSGWEKLTKEPSVTWIELKTKVVELGLGMK